MIPLLFACVGGGVVQAPGGGRPNPWGQGLLNHPVSIGGLHQTLCGSYRVPLSLERPINAHGKAYSIKSAFWNPSSNVDIEQVHTRHTFQDAATFALDAYATAQAAAPTIRHVKYRLAGSSDTGFRIEPTAVSNIDNAWIEPMNPHDVEVSLDRTKTIACEDLHKRLIAQVEPQIPLSGVMLRGGYIPVSEGGKPLQSQCTPLPGSLPLREHEASILAQMTEQIGEPYVSISTIGVLKPRHGDTCPPDELCTQHTIYLMPMSYIENRYQLRQLSDNEKNGTHHGFKVPDTSSRKNRYEVRLHTEAVAP